MALSIPQVVRQFKADVAKALSRGNHNQDLRLPPLHLARPRARSGDDCPRLFAADTSWQYGLYRLAALGRFVLHCRRLLRRPHAFALGLVPRPARNSVCDALYPEIQDAGRWRGHRTWTSDGSSFSMPDTPEPCKPISDSPPTRAKAAVFRWRTSWPYSMRALVCC